MDINMAVVKGRLTHDPKVVAGNGVTFFNFSVATNTVAGKEQRTEYHSVNYPAFSEKEAELLKTHLVKGASVYAEGDMRVYEKREGGGKMFYVRAASLQLLSFVDEQQDDTPAIDDEAHALGGFIDDDPAPPARPQAPAQPPRGRDLPAVAPRPRVQATTMTPPLTPAVGGEVIF